MRKQFVEIKEVLSCDKEYFKVVLKSITDYSFSLWGTWVLAKQFWRYQWAVGKMQGCKVLCKIKNFASIWSSNVHSRHLQLGPLRPGMELYQQLLLCMFSAEVLHTCCNNDLDVNWSTDQDARHTASGHSCKWRACAHSWTLTWIHVPSMHSHSCIRHTRTPNMRTRKRSEWTKWNMDHRMLSQIFSPDLGVSVGPLLAKSTIVRPETYQ